MKKSIVKKTIAFFALFLCVVAICTAQTPALNDSTAVLNFGGINITWGMLAPVILIVIEAILRRLPTGKYASILGIIHWLDNNLPATVVEKKPPTDKTSNGAEHI